MPVPIAELFIAVSADVSGAIGGLNTLNNQVNSLGNTFRQAAPAAAVLTAAAAGIGAGFVSAISTAADFQHQMSGVKAVLSPDEVDRFGDALSNLALKLGRDTVFSSSQAASAIEELVKAGIPVEAVLGGAAAAALSLAAATGITTTEAATIASQAMNIFGVSAAELNSVVDRLGAVANASASDVSFLRFGLAAVGGVAAGVGLSLNDTLVTLGLLSNRFATGADAGTSFKAFLNGLIPDTKKQKEAFKQLGLTLADGSNAFFDANGNIKDMAQVAGILHAALQGLTAEQRQQALTTIFGTDGQRAANAIFELGQQKVAEFSAATAGSGVAAQSAQTRMDNLQGVLQNLAGSIETVQIQIGNFFLPGLQALATAAKGLVDGFSTLSPEAQKFLAAIAGVGGGILGAIGGFAILGRLLIFLAPSFAALIRLLPVMVGLFGPIGLAALALAANFGGLRTRIQNAFAGAEPILRNFGLVFDKVVNGDVSGALDTFQAILGALVPGLAPVLAGVRNAVGQFFTDFGPVFANFGLVFEKVLNGDLGGAFDTFRAIVGTVSEPLGNFLGIVQQVAGFIVGQLVPGIADLADRTMPILADVGARLGEVWDTKLSPALQTVGIWLSGTLVPFFLQLGEQVLPTLESASKTLAEFWDTKMQPAFQKVGDFVDQHLITSIRDLGTALSSITTEQVAQAGNAFGTTLLQPLQAFGTQLQPLIPVFQSVGNFFTALSNVISAFQSIGAKGEGGADTTVSGLQRLTDFVRANADIGDIINKSFGPFGALFVLLRDNAAAVTGFVNGLADALNRFADAIRNMPTPPAWIIPFLHGDIIGGAAGLGGSLGTAATTPAPRPDTGFFSQTNQPAGPAVVIGQVTISSEVDADRFLARLAGQIADAAGRVVVPPDNSSHPTLLPSVT